MKRRVLPLVLWSCVTVLFAEPSAYLPPSETVSRVPVIPPEEVSITVSGQALRPAILTTRQSLNGEWKISGLVNSATPFAPDVDLDMGYAAPDFDDSQWDDITVPLDWYKQYKQAYQKEHPYVKGWYRHSFELDAADLTDRRVILHFTRIGYEAIVFANGREVGRHHGDFTQFEVDVTDDARPGRNVVALRVLSDFGPAFGRREKAVHAYGSQWSISNIRGGLWGDVTLRLEPAMTIRKLLIDPLPRCPGHEQEYHALRVSYVVQNHSGVTRNIRLVGVVSSAMRADANLANPSQPVQRIADWRATEYQLAPDEPNVHCGQYRMDLADEPAPQLWDVDRPYLYFFTLVVLDENDRVLTARTERFGLRRFETRDGRFFLNGREIYLFGENIASASYGGYPISAEELEAKLTDEICNERGNGYVMMRNAHMPMLPVALRVADEAGMMFFNEWAWSFTSAIDEEPFAEHNLPEVRQFVEDSYNYPSVCMWSMGNEVRHSGRPDIVRQMNAQDRLVREMDGQGRPVSAFSGAAGWGSYGRNPLDTDVLDLHTYVSLSNPWTQRDRQADSIYNGLLEIYGEKERLSRPLVAWENVGFSWGWKIDRKFRLGNVDDYLKYAKSETSWGRPNGIGFSGCIGLAEAVAPGSTPRLPMTLYGRRIFELYRLDRRFTGFAPWFSDSRLPAATLWTQPVLPTLHSERNFPPRNLFIGESSPWVCEIVNSSNTAYADLCLTVQLVGPKDVDVRPLATWPIPALAAQSHFVSDVTLTLPTVVPGHYQLRLTLEDVNHASVGQNYYDLYLQNRAEIAGPIPPVRSVAVFDTGTAENVTALREKLDALRISHQLTADPEALKPGTVLIIPPEIAPQTLTTENARSLEHFVAQGGVLLVLEQHNPASLLPGAYAVSAGETTFCDRILPEHPLFADMGHRYLDTWDDGDLCMVVRASYQPFTVNAVAARGPRLGRKSVGMAVLEATWGNGRLLYSQLEAFACADRDSSAALYLRNLLRYACASREWWPDTRELVPAASLEYSVNPERLVPITIGAFTNRGFSDDVDGDTLGGWTDQGTNDFRMMPLGRHNLAGVDFTILDPAANNGTSCIVLAGTGRPKFPTSAKGIPLQGTYSRLFFLHTAAWGSAEKVGKYRIHYADGTAAEMSLIGGRNIGDWWQSSPLPEAMTGIIAANSEGRKVRVFVTSWENPRPDVPLTTLDFLSPLYNDDNAIDYLPTQSGVPVLVAVTGETAHPRRYDILGNHYKNCAGTKDHGSTIPGKIAEVDLDGRRAWQIEFPASPPGEVPVAFFFFELIPEALGDQYDFLTLRVKSDHPGPVLVSLPEKNWHGTCQGTLRLIADNQFHTYRLRIGEDIKPGGSFTFPTMRGELFFYYKARGSAPPQRDAMRLVVDQAILE